MPSITRSSARKQSASLHKTNQPHAVNISTDKVPNTSKTAITSSTKSFNANKHYTHLNSDKDCLQNPQSFWQTAFYRLQLYNGLYMLDRSEQVFLYSLALVVLLLVAWYGYAFLHGLVDGWSNAATVIVE
ncbi:hypothetical protein MPSEU_000055600 [Mayamaea pseudoterrestris]|nr:hypothetical protein MPSEU_000055600 [Mayamaea pseudoterrestris]